MRPGAGKNERPGSSPLILNSIEWPRMTGSSNPSDSPIAIRNCSRTKSIPLISSLTGCSTCKRVFTSKKEIVPSRPIKNSHVPAPMYPASFIIALLERYSSSFCASVKNGAGASSTSFWWRRCSEQSRVLTTTAWPCLSTRTWVSTWRGLSK